MNDLYELATKVLTAKELIEKQPRMYSLNQLDEDLVAVPVIDVGNYRVIFYRECCTVINKQTLVAYPHLYLDIDELVIALTM